MFGPLMLNWVGGEVDCTDVITIYHSGPSERRVKFLLDIYPGQQSCNGRARPTRTDVRGARALHDCFPGYMSNSEHELIVT
jgi:hypothetical protein